MNLSSAKFAQRVIKINLVGHLGVTDTLTLRMFLHFDLSSAALCECEVKCGPEMSLTC